MKTTRKDIAQLIREHDDRTQQGQVRLRDVFQEAAEDWRKDWKCLSDSVAAALVEGTLPFWQWLRAQKQLLGCRLCRTGVRELRRALKAVPPPVPAAPQSTIRR